MISTYKYSIYLIVLCISIFSCNNSNNEHVIARVGKATLTLESLKNSIPNEYSNQITRDQNICYVKQWIDRELLFQEALNQKIDKESVIKERLEKMKKDLLSSELLSRVSMKSQSDSLNDSVFKQYYKKNQSQYVRDKDYVKYIDITAEDSKKAWEIYRTANKSNINTIALQNSKNQSFDSTNVPYFPLETTLPEIRQIIVTTAINTISLPIKTNNGYHIIDVLDKLDKGGICSYSEVRKEIASQLIMIEQKTKIDKLLSDLRIKSRVEFNVNLISESIK
jgi:parvulin-like peptidyl-prolyl isomerase